MSEINESLAALRAFKASSKPLTWTRASTILDQLIDLQVILGEAAHANANGFKMNNGKHAHDGFELAIDKATYKDKNP